MLAGIGRGLTLPVILDAAYLPEALREHPRVVVPYLVTRDNFAARLDYQQEALRSLAGRPECARPASG